MSNSTSSSFTIPPGYDYLIPLYRDEGPQLRNPNQVAHLNLKRGKWYYRIRRDNLQHSIAQTDKSIIAIIRMPRQDELLVNTTTQPPTYSIDYNLDPPEFYELQSNGTVDTLGAEIGEYDELYMCKNKLCQDSGTGHPEQAGGGKKRYPKTRKAIVKKKKLSRKSK
jgi:hypothetical protein